MKKMYLCALALSVGSLSFGQKIIKRSFEKTYLKAIKIENQKSDPTSSFSAKKRAGGDTLWSEKFDNGIPSGWTSVDVNNTSYKWIVNTGFVPESSFIGPNYPVLTPNPGNYMLLPSGTYNDGLQHPNLVDMNAYFQTASIPLVNIPGVSVTFKQCFERCCLITDPAGNGPQTILSVSKFEDHRTGSDTREYDIIGGVSGNERFNGTTTVNISAIAANYTGDIYLRFHVRSGTSLYYWSIDDIALIESQNNDLVATQASYDFFGTQYTRLPANHIRPANFSMASNNIGGANQPGSQLRVRVSDRTSNIWEFSTPDTTLSSLSIDTIYINQNNNSGGQWTPPATPLNKAYTIYLDILSDSTDITPDNNEHQFPPLEITKHIMALDDYSATPQSNSANGGNQYEIGNQFDATEDDILYGIEIVIGSGSTPGGYFDLAVYEVTGSREYTELWRSINYEITSNMIGTTQTFPLRDLNGDPKPLALTANSTYLAVAHNQQGFEYASSGSGPFAGTLKGIDHTISTGGTFGNPQANTRFSINTAMIRLNFDETVGINQANETTKFNVYPNPSNGNFIVNLEAELAKTVNLSIQNLVGQTIVNKRINVAGKSKETVSLADYSKGVYFLTIDKKTVKVIVK